jgi:hypothetical protein
MVHRPYEDWLLNDEKLTLEQERELRQHTSTCVACAALARANLALRSASMAAPAPGFALRFQARLEAERRVEKKRAVLGMGFLTLAGAGLLVLLVLPLLPYLSVPPAELFVAWITTLVYILTTLQALGTVGSVFARALFNFVPAYAWLVAVLLFGGVSVFSALLFQKARSYVYSAA